jgi:glutamyl-tRNA synthetase
MGPEALNTAIKKRALQNAIRHGGKAERGAVVSKLIGDHPELRQQAAEVSGSAEKIIAEINALTLDEQRGIFEDIAPELQQSTLKQHGEKIYLPELPHHERVIMRFSRYD